MTCDVRTPTAWLAEFTLPDNPPQRMVYLEEPSGYLRSINIKDAVITPLYPSLYEPTKEMIAEGWRAAAGTMEWTHEAVRYFWQRMYRAQSTD